MFGYRVLGFGGHTVAAAGDNITWATTISSVTYSDKVAVDATGFDTNTPINGASYGSVGDSTIDGMNGNSGGVVSITACNWLNWNNAKKTFGIKLREAGASDSTEQTGWTSITVNGVTFAKADASFNSNRSQGSHSDYANEYEFSWSAGSNPFGTTGSTTVDVSMSNA